MALKFSRSRSTQTKSPTTILLSWKVRNGAGGSQVLGTNQFFGDLSSIDDTPSPFFKQRMQNGEIIMNDLLIQEWSRDVSPGRHSYSSSYYEYATYEGDLTAWVQANNSVMNPLEGDYPQMEAAAITKALSRVNKPTVLSGEILSDLDRTVGMVSEPFKAIWDVLGKHSKLTRKLARKGMPIGRAMQNAWLQYRYAITPAVLDVNAVVKESLRKRSEFEVMRLVARAEVRNGRKATIDFADKPLTGFDAGLLASGSALSVKDARVAAGIIYTLPTKNHDHWSKQVGVRAEDLLTTIWEVIPASFVVDWFVNIGDWLGAITPQPDVNILGAWTTTISTATLQYQQGLLRKWIDSSWVNGYYGTSTEYHKSVTRNSKPDMTPTVVVYPKITLHRAIDALALLGQMSKQYR